MKAYKHHLIKNFDKDTPLFKKIFANIIFLVGITKISWRGSKLTPRDYKNALKIIRKGDVLLTGSHRRASGLFIRGNAKHVALYIGGGKIIHAISDGVVKQKFRNLFSEYDTFAILRPKLEKNKDKTIRKAVDYMKSQVGKPFDFFFASGQENFFCSQLVNDAYTTAGLHTGLTSHKKAQNIIDKKIKLLEVNRALHPKEFFDGNFDIVFLSESLKDMNVE